jgi:hypothetical protein
VNDDDDGENGVLLRGGEAPPEAHNSDLRHGNRDSYINFMKRVPLSGQKSNKSDKKKKRDSEQFE